ncbi:MAG: 5-carboxymethyl-2-hydroxymuconate Delta-isomerase [Gammaproteobacteria bacterium]|nr:5-carboxymethyl-2-hydroxymuconate Delta-isomerase [Gammaproteobacteria bacterium]
MPHQVIEYSANLDTDMDIDELVTAMHATAASIDALPLGGIRTRAVRRDHYRIADGHPDNAFINVTLRVAPRSPEVKKDAGERLFQALRDFVQPLFDKRPMSLSLEIQELDPENRWKHSNIRDYLARRNS